MTRPHSKRRATIGSSRAGRRAEVQQAATARVVANSGTQAIGAKRGADINIVAGLEMKKSKAPDADATSAGAHEHQGVGAH
jgi:hypothetical protein